MNRRLRPLSLSLVIILLDQVTKALVVKLIPENSIGISLFGDFLRIVHVRNTAVAFSIGTGLDESVKILLFIILPLVVMALVCAAIVTRRGERELSELERWCLAGVLGGGLGNLIDRVFRGFRVVDFISNKFYGLFGMDRWPTYNIADSAVVVSVIILAIALIFESREKKNE